MSTSPGRGAPDTDRTRRSLRRRVRRMRRRARRHLRRWWRRNRRYALAIGALGLAALVYVGWLVARVGENLVRVNSDAGLISVALRTGDDAGLSRGFEDLRRAAAASERGTGGPTWAVLSRLPWVGDDARGVRTLSVVAAQLSSGSMERLAVRQRELHSVLPSHGRVDLAAVQSLAPIVGASRVAVDDAQRRLDAQDGSGLVGPLRASYTELQQRVNQLAGMLGAADAAAQVLPQMLGQGGQTRHYLLVLQNNAEIRASGGLPGAISEVVAHDGNLSISRQLSGADFPKTDVPVLPLSPVEQALYGVQLGDWFLDSNFTPDFPRTAQLMAARWEQALGEHIDGVVSLDPVTLSYLLSAVGPVRVDGVQLTSQNVVDELLHDTYVRLAPADQDGFFRAVTKAVFDRFVGGGAQPALVAEALSRGAAEHRVLLHDFSPEVQSHIDQTGVAGVLTRDMPTHPQVGIYFNDSTGAKMSYYLRYQTVLAAHSCSAGRQQLSGVLTVGSDAPADAASMPVSVTGGGVYGVPPGDQVVTVRIFGPIGGSIGDVRLDGAYAVQQEAFQLDGRPVVKLWAALSPGQVHKVAWSMTSGQGQTGSTYAAMTPSVEPVPSSVVLPSACR